MSVKVNGEIRYSRKEAAARLGMSVPKLDRETSKRHIEFYQPYAGGRITFSEDQLREYDERCRRPTRIAEQRQRAA